MNDGTYKGDSAGKKITRAKLWLAACNIMASLDIPYRGSLVLTGHGGDLNTMQGWGIKPESIAAADRVHSLTVAAHKAHPRCHVATADVDQVAAYRNYNAVHLDFCNGINVENILTTAEVIRNVSLLPAWIGVTFMKGREQTESNSPLVPDLHRSERKERKRMFKRMGMDTAARLMAHGRFNPTIERRDAERRLRKIMPPDVMCDADDVDRIFNGFSQSPSNRIYDKYNRMTGLGKAMIRVDVLRQALMAQLLDEDILLRPMVVYSYHSGEPGKRGSGTPFVTVGYVAVHASQAGWLDDAVYDIGCLMRWEQLPTDLGIRGLKHCALDLLASYSASEVAQIFDIKKGTVNAWKAHDTMGTYRDEMVDMAEHCVGFSPMNGEVSELRYSDLGWGKTKAKLQSQGKGKSSDEVIHEMMRQRQKRMEGGPRHPAVEDQTPTNPEQEP